MKLLDRMRQQKLLSTTLMLFTLSIGIVIGTLVNTGVNAAKAQNVAPDATPLVVPQAVETGNEFSKLAKKISPSVVNITADYLPKAPQTTHNRRARPQQGDDQEGNGEDPSTDLFRRFFGNQSPGLIVPPQDSSKHEQSGTGFVVDKNGYVVTNKHVVSDENGNPVDHIKVKVHGEDAEYRAKLIGFDRETDVAVLKIDAHRPLQPVTIANSEAVQVGDWAVAIGSPFGLQETVTAGIVSALNRANIGDGQFQRFIQTDAAINPGNSGGPLLNIRGEVIGINTMIATRSGAYEGIGFALPVNMMVRVYNDIIRDGHVTRGSIGITWQTTKPEALKAMGFDHGVIIEDVHKDGPADKAGVKAEDVVLGINGKPLKDGDDLMSRVADMPVGTACVLNVDRDGKKMEFKLVVMDRLKVFWDDPRVVGEVKNLPTANSEEEKPEVSKLVTFGIGVRPLTDDERALTTDKHGMMVTRVEANSFAADIGMLEHDIITSVDRHPVNSIEDVKKIQATLKPGDPVVFRVVRTAGTVARGHGTGTPATQVLLLPGTLPE
ncbi:MAG TPA: Do family serine endopeptidase [Bryobacteraceae bacterium]|nr:Do family serine endopeptidase [Bryobacteraceae bacterium]